MQVTLLPACLSVPGGADETVGGWPFSRSLVALLDVHSVHMPDTVLDTGGARSNKIKSDTVIGELSVQGGEALINSTLR